MRGKIACPLGKKITSPPWSHSYIRLRQILRQHKASNSSISMPAARWRSLWVSRPWYPWPELRKERMSHASEILLLRSTVWAQVDKTRTSSSMPVQPTNSKVPASQQTSWSSQTTRMTLSHQLSQLWEAGRLTSQHPRSKSNWGRTRASSLAPHCRLSNRSVTWRPLAQACFLIQQAAWGTHRRALIKR